MRAHVVTISYLERILIFMAELDVPRSMTTSCFSFQQQGEEELGVVDLLLE